MDDFVARKDLHDTRVCNPLLEPETNDDLRHQVLFFGNPIFVFISPVL